MPSRFALGTKRLVADPFFVFLIVGAVLYLNSWNNEFLYDEIHLIRSFSLSELGYVFVGNWDPNHTETRGYRPLTTVYFHVQYFLFGENVIAHRCSLVLLAAAMLRVMVQCFRLVGVPQRAAVLTGLIVLCLPTNFFHIAWLPDGSHLFGGLLGFGSILFGIRAADGRNSEVFPLHLCGLLATATREENFFLYAIGFGFPLINHFLRCRPVRIGISRALMAFALPGIAVGLLMFTLRKTLVPHVLGVTDFTNNLPRLYSYFKYALSFNFDLLALRTSTLLDLWFAVLGVIFLLSIPFMRRTGEWRPFLWSCMCFGATIVPLILLYRNNLILNSSCFAAVLIALPLDALFSRSPRVLKGAMAVALSVLLLAMAHKNVFFQQILHPYNLLVIEYQSEALADKTLTIPPARRDSLKAKMVSLGLPAEFSKRTYQRHMAVLRRRALQNDARAPDGATVFIHPASDEGM